MIELSSEDKFLLLKRVNNLVRGRNQTAVELGMCLVDIYESKAYQDITGPGGSFTQYLGDPDVKLPMSSAMRYMGIARKYILELNVPPKNLIGLDTNSLYRIKDKVTKENVDEWLERIRTLSRSDIHRLVKYGETDVMTCDHIWELMPAKYLCNKCGEKTNNPT